MARVRMICGTRCIVEYIVMSSDFLFLKDFHHALIPFSATLHSLLLRMQHVGPLFARPRTSHHRCDTT